jgi:hypothetical protein
MPLSTNPFRTRTPAELKWLLNERAALCGRLAAYAEPREELRARVFRLETELQASRAALSVCDQAIAEVSAAIAALDTTMHLGFPQAAPASAGVVRAHTKYGERGALTNFLQGHLRRMSPQSFTAAELRSVVVPHFGLTFLTPREQRKFRSSFSKMLIHIRDRQGTIENLSVGEPAQTRWRWKQAPTLDELRRMVERSSLSEEEPPHERAPHPNKI